MNICAATIGARSERNFCVYFGHYTRIVENVIRTHVVQSVLPVDECELGRENT